MLPIGDDGPEESESESCRVSSSLSCPLSSGWRTMGGHFLSAVLVISIFGDRNRFETGKGDNGGVEPSSMSWILTKGGWENEIHNKASTYITQNQIPFLL
jgi:hypothetical protein